jgi:hypothetical protein
VSHAPAAIDESSVTEAVVSLFREALAEALKTSIKDGSGLDNLASSASANWPFERAFPLRVWASGRSEGGPVKLAPSQTATVYDSDGEEVNIRFGTSRTMMLSPARLGGAFGQTNPFAGGYGLGDNAQVPLMSSPTRQGGAFGHTNPFAGGYGLGDNPQVHESAQARYDHGGKQRGPQADFVKGVCFDWNTVQGCKKENCTFKRFHGVCRACGGGHKMVQVEDCDPAKLTIEVEKMIAKNIDPIFGGPLGKGRFYGQTVQAQAADAIAAAPADRTYPSGAAAKEARSAAATRRSA